MLTTISITALNNMYRYYHYAIVTTRTKNKD